MEETIVELKNLREQILIIDGNIKFNINVFLGLLSLFLASAGWGLSLFAKSIVEKGMNTKSIEIKREVRQELTGELHKKIQVRVLEIPDGGTIYLPYDLQTEGRPSIFKRSHSEEKSYVIEARENEIIITDSNAAIYPRGSDVPKH